ncbi:MAG: tetratricopeptide repeat protein [Thermodesulfobacteriota bacterium]
MSSIVGNRESAPPQFIGSTTCAECHKAEYELWIGSHHDLAMKDANDVTVLGDFNNKKFDYYGLKSEFYKQDGKFMVRTDGPDGELHHYEIKYTFGVYPLQQYLIELPDGRLQAFGIAWDSRPREGGGQRWFHLYPNEKISHNDRLHWTGVDQNWNYMCAECHSTNLKKNYDLKTNTFNTTWSEINVSCEACHGPGSKHVKWARQKKTDGFPNMGLLVSYNERKGVSWTINKTSGNAVRSEPLGSHTEIEFCSRCHSRRSAISDNYVYGQSLLDTHIPTLLDEGVYYPDGQIEAEDYEWGSFLQSKMYHIGVTCTDCHNAHSLKLRAEGNLLCAGCHQAEKYDTPSHHHHKPLSAGSHCVACHMPQTNYMIVDARRDHSIRIPRPDLTVKIGTPNACNKCHTDRTPEWAASEIKSWSGGNYKGFQNYGETLYEARTGAARAEEPLVKLANDENEPSIARATALKGLGEYLSPSSILTVEKGLKNKDPLIRGAALDALGEAPTETRSGLAFRLLNDSVLAVRIKAVTILASVPKENLTAGQEKALDEALKEYVRVQMTNADRPEAHINIGLIYAELGRFSEAEFQYETAMKLEPSFIPAYVNLADLYRMEGRDNEGERFLRRALEISPRNGDVYHALGLLLVRQNKIPEAMHALEESVKFSPDNTRYNYVYAVALNDTGKKTESIRVLEEINMRHPGDREVLYALINFNRENGRVPEALEYAEKLVELSPEDSGARRILQELKKIANR